ncbi:DUF1481 domain-containing protein [Photobacterium sp. 1_MG-2023]|uniref:DUF1481 domain-containing protein n=1 Tax=Photobacterium sp. 1_MG-2023 TaxID=3062646 RepID=UPI0026E327D4|nr:DUF1481 domain-containing protein [Photobacterium sp. 1_MG-2023]MDO6707858.1 DUF1481 domain-containing protein [Photobacterium sp. 1_MG-2023]
MKRTCLILLTLLLSACGATPLSQHARSSSELLTGGQVAGDAASLYWASFRQSKPESLSERVWVGEYGEYQTDYRWREGRLRELKRTGTALKDNTVQPFELHVRYDQHGEAVFQRYKVGDAVYPLSDIQLNQLSQQAEQVMDVVKSQSRDGLELVQGIWDGQRLIRCDSQKALAVESLQTALSGYVALVGKPQGPGKLTAETVLLNRTATQSCIERPVLLGEAS